MKIIETFALIILLLVLLVPVHVDAGQELNIGLTRFEAFPLDNAVQVEWDTETELGTVGYRLKRGQNGSFSYLMEPGGSTPLFIISTGGPSLGAEYEVVDDKAINDETYTYQLIEVTADGLETVQANTSVTVGLVPTNTPIVLGGGNDPIDNNDSATSEPSSTPTSTPTALQTATNTPVTSPTTIPALARSATPRPTATSVSELPRLDNPDTSQHVDGSGNALSPITTVLNDLGSNSEGIEVARALEEPTIAQVASSAEAQAVEVMQITQSPLSSEDGVSLTISNPNTGSRPVIIGRHTLADSPLQAENSDLKQENDSSGSPLTGLIYLWIAFLAALVIFIASVIGAILLYTRRRKKDI